MPQSSSTPNITEAVDAMQSQSACPEEPARHGKNVSIAEFRQILIWPLALSDPDHNDNLGVAEIIRQEAARLDREHMFDGVAATWQRVPDPLFHLKMEVGEPQGPDVKRQEPYAEFAYFHDFVQRFLYPDRQKHLSGEAAFHLFQRSDIRGVQADIGTLTFAFRVERCNLYLFRTGVAILVLEITSKGGTVAESVPDTSIRANGKSLTLEHVLLFQDCFRRVYTPYFSWENERYQPSEVPRQITWLGEDGTALASEAGALPLEKEMERLAEHREPPVFSHWRWLLGLKLRGYGQQAEEMSAAHNGKQEGQACWRHVIDDRIPFMSYVRIDERGLAEGVKPLSLISRGDWIRLCFADQPSDELGSYPYDQKFP